MSTTHPDRELLQAFALGALSGADHDAVEVHVAKCDACCQMLAGVSEDDLVRRVKESGSNGDELAETIVFDRDAPQAEAMPTGLPPELVGHPRYRILRQLGKGGMGMVYQAEHLRMGRQVTLKVLNRALTFDENAVERFQREVRAAAQLNHRNIVTAHDADSADGLHFLVMEFVEGTDLAKVVKKRGPLPVLHACNYVRQVAAGLQHAHENGMVHRDIKPQNLMLTPQGKVKILDFGLARLVSEKLGGETMSASGETEDALTSEGAALGTPDYIAPEQARDSRTADIRADIYSLGCTFYYLLAARPPFPRGSSVEKLVAHLEHQPQPLSELREEVPLEIRQIVERMMEKDPAARFQTPQEIVDALTPFAQKTSSPPPAIAPATVPTPPPAQMAEIDVTQEMQTPVSAIELQPMSAVQTHPADNMSVTAPATSFAPQQQVTSKNWLGRGGSMLVIAGCLAALLLGFFAIYSIVGSPWSSGVVGQRDIEKPAPMPNRQPTALYVLPQRSLWWPDFSQPRDALENAGIRVVVASSSMSEISAGQNTQQVDLLLRDADPDDYDMVLFGGSPDPLREIEFCQKDSEHRQTATNFINEMLREGKYVATVCNGTAVLAESGCLNGLRAANIESRIQDQYPDVIWVREQTVQSSDQILTANGTGLGRREFDERIVSMLTKNAERSETD